VLISLLNSNCFVIPSVILQSDVLHFQLFTCLDCQSCWFYCQ